MFSQPSLILLPVLVQIVLTLVVLALVAGRRQASMRERGPSPQDMALARDEDCSKAARQAHNNSRNQFELPVLFYAVCTGALAAGLVDAWLLGLSMLFAAARLLHAVLHIGPNVVAWRGSVFAVGALTLIAMCARLGGRILTQGV